VLEPVWAASDHLCGKPLAPMILVLVGALARHHGLRLAPRAPGQGRERWCGELMAGMAVLVRVSVLLGPSDREVGRGYRPTLETKIRWAPLLPVTW
jgi:hypothetical protein